MTEKIKALHTLDGRIKHGHTIGRNRSSEYLAWTTMRYRCLKPNHPKYSNYGGRNVSVCERWAKSFCNFLEDMGLKPTTLHSLERVDNSKGYEPGNCVWATMKVQALNKRSNVLLTAGGKTQTLHEWAIEVGMNEKTLWTRCFRLGWDSVRAIFTPIDTKNRNGNAKPLTSNERAY